MLGLSSCVGFGVSIGFGLEAASWVGFGVSAGLFGLGEWVGMEFRSDPESIYWD